MRNSDWQKQEADGLGGIGRHYIRTWAGPGPAAAETWYSWPALPFRVFTTFLRGWENSNTLGRAKGKQARAHNLPDTGF